MTPTTPQRVHWLTTTAATSTPTKTPARSQGRLFMSTASSEPPSHRRDVPDDARTWSKPRTTVVPVQFCVAGQRVSSALLTLCRRVPALRARGRNGPKALHQVGVVQGLDEVIIKSRLAGFPAVFFLTPSGERHDEDVTAPRL